MRSVIQRRIASASARRQGFARCARRLTPPLTATAAPAQQVVSSRLTRLLRSSTTGSNTKFLTTPMRLDDPRVIQLRELSRVDEDLQREGNQLANRLREQLHRFYVQALQLCPSADEPWLWTLLELAPSPSVAQRLRPKRVERLLRAHRIRRLNADDVVSALRVPALTVAPGVVEAATEHIALLLPRLRLVHSQRQRCGARLEALLDDLQAAGEEDDNPGEHSDVAILRSLPGVGRIVAATIIAEACVALTERNYDALRAHAGIAPITKQSGKHRTVLMRYACNGRLRQALYHCARVAVMRDLPSKTYYTAQRQRGHTHGRALRAAVRHPSANAGTSIWAPSTRASAPYRRW